MMKIVIWAVILFSFYNSNIQQTIKILQLNSGTIIRHDTVLSGRSRMSIKRPTSGASRRHHRIRRHFRCISSMKCASMYAESEITWLNHNSTSDVVTLIIIKLGSITHPLRRDSCQSYAIRWASTFRGTRPPFYFNASGLIGSSR